MSAQPARLVIFDLDDTLCDYRTAREAALAAVEDVLRESEERQ